MHGARPWIWAGLGIVLAIVLVAGAREMLTGSAGSARTALAQPSLATPGLYGHVPPFSLVGADGERVTQDDLAGRFWIADFIFTRCTGVCPTLTARMASLSRQLADAPDIRLVTFSVDPDYDTPEVLRIYPARGSDERWMFLTGRTEEIYRLVGDGFRLNVAAGGPPGAGSGELVTHSDRFVIVDPDLNIRGYYHGTDEEEVGRLAADLRALMRERAGRRP